MSPRRALLAAALLLILTGPAAALDEVVHKRVVVARDFPLLSGETLPELRLGVETYGQLDPTGENAVLVCHFFAGDSHAAGRKGAQDPERGWWDALIGPGKPLDTDRFFVVSTDLPCGMMVKDPWVVTTGPSSIDPRTGEPYGMRFPATSLRDLVRAQRAVLDALGVRRLACVTGPSLGGMLALSWAVEYPDFVERAVPVAAPLEFSAQERAGFRSAALAIQADPSWAFGDYARYGTEPLLGVAMALRGLSAIAEGRGWQLPWLLPSYLADARRFDANHYLYTLAIHEGYDLAGPYATREAALQRVRARVVLIGFDDDRFVTPEELAAGRDELAAAGVAVELAIVPGRHGHLSAVEDLDVIAPPLAAALAP